MDKLPQELIDLIADEIIMNETCEGLSSYAAISKKWQRVMERCTFQEVHARANSLEFDFSLGQRVLGVESRRRALWELRLLISLPPIGLERKAIKQRHLDARQNDIVLTHAIFRALTVISTSGGNCNPFCLNLKLKAQGNLPRKKGNGLFAGDSIYYVKFNKTILGMYGGLPEATAIDSFSLCKTLPNVATLHWAFAPPPRRHIILRRAFRSLFAKTLHGIAEDLPNLKVLHLVCEDEDPWNHHYFPINYVQPGSSGDQLSLALPRASQLPSLRKLCVQGRIAVSRQIFGSGTEEPQTWPSLEELTLSCRKQHQMGDGMETFRWLPLRRGKRPDASLGGHCVAVESDDPDTALFDKQSVRSRESGNFPVCRFRMIPDPVTFMALLVSMARAIQHMPALKTIELEWEMENGLCWGVNYYAAGFLPSSCSVNEEAAWADFNYCRDEKCVYHEDKHRPNSVLEFHYIHRTRPRWLCSQGGRYKIAISALGLPEFVLPPGLVKMLRALSKGGTFYIRDSRRRRWQ